MSDIQVKTDKVKKIMWEKNVDALIISDRYNMNYVSGYMGDTGMLLFTPGNQYVLTDSRYTEIAGRQAVGFECVDIGQDGYSKTIKSLLSDIFANPENMSGAEAGNNVGTDGESLVINIGFEDESISYKQYMAFYNEFCDVNENTAEDAAENTEESATEGVTENTAENATENTAGKTVDSDTENSEVSGGIKKINIWKLQPLGTAVNELRMVKSKEEIEKIATAEAIGDKAFSHIIGWIKPGMTEQEVALELEVAMRKAGATGLSFETIAASGENSSMPHAVPTNRKLAAGDFLTMDFGCIYEGYCSDMTRTVFISGVETSPVGNLEKADNEILYTKQDGGAVDIECQKKSPSGKQLEIYNTVLKAQLEAMKLIKPGAVCSDIDARAREIIADAGYGDYFGHGLGHSVGLFIHEEPRFSKKCDTVLEPGMVITVEPGIYLPGEFGVRIEDLIVVTEDGYENLTHSTKELEVISE